MNAAELQAIEIMLLQTSIANNAVWIVVGVMWTLAIPLALGRFWWYTSFARTMDE